MNCFFPTFYLLDRFVRDNKLIFLHNRNSSFENYIKYDLKIST